MNASLKCLTAAAVAAAFGLSACGGGGGGGSGSATTPTGTVNLQVTDGPSDEFQHVWVTITSVAFHTDPNAVWTAGDASWQTYALAQPVTVDLSALSNGALDTVFSGLSLPAGSYRQIRLFLAPADGSLQPSAFDTLDSNGNPLATNDQVEYLDGASNWAVTEAPLEIAYPTQGIQLLGSFNVTAGAALQLAVDFDLEHIIVPFNHGGMTYFTMRPNLKYYDMSQVGAITGSINPALLCRTVAAATAAAPGCAYNLIVKAELLSPDGSRHYVARETTVDPATGNFTLYPLATQDASGQAIGSYDIVIRGREMETMLVTGVPVSLGTQPGGTGPAAPTVIQSTAITPVLNSAEYTAQFASPLSPLSSGYAIFQQTLPVSASSASPVPYEIRWRNTDPFLGSFRNPIPLQGATSMLHLAAYNGGQTLTFSAVAPQEGQGAFTVADNEAAYYTLSAGTVMSPPTAPATTTRFTPGAPALAAGVQSGTLQVNLAFNGIVNDDSCAFVLARFATIIDADVTDCTAILASGAGTQRSGSFTLGGVPAGEPGTYYYAYVRIWNSADPFHSRQILPLDGFVDLRQATSRTLSGSLTGS
jgi:hypothetical protein